MLMKVVTLNSALDSDEVPDEILDDAILRQISYISSDFRTNSETGSRLYWKPSRTIRDSTASRSGLENTFLRVIIGAKGPKTS